LKKDIRLDHAEQNRRWNHTVRLDPTSGASRAHPEARGLEPVGIAWAIATAKQGGAMLPKRLGVVTARGSITEHFR
jgi:hypothetical protein